MVGTLIKVNLRALFAGIFRRSRKKKRIKPVNIILIVLLAIYIVGAIGFSVGMMFYNLCGVMLESGIGWFYFSLAGIMIFALCFIGSIFMVQSQIFTARDNELLLSMPIKPSAILAGRVSALLVFEYIFEAIILLPVIAALIISGYITWLPVTGIVFLIIAALLLPLMPLSLGCFFGWLLALLTARMRNKNIVTFVLSLAFMVAYFWFYSRIGGYIQELLVNGAEIAEAVRRAAFPAYHFGAAIMDGNPLSLLIFALCALTPFIAMYAILSATFLRLTTMGRGVRKIKYREKSVRASGANAALVKREFLRFWSNPMYILNAALGAIAHLAAAAVLIVRPSLITGILEQLGAVIPGASPALLGAIGLTALASVNYVSAPSISLEGKTLWLIKSLPVEPKTILLSKVSFHNIACGTPALLAAIVCIFRLPDTGYLGIPLLIALPTAATNMFALLGVVLNLAFPRFDWINEIQPVKQGMSCMLTMLIGMALVIALALVYGFLLSDIMAIELYLIACQAFFALVSIGLNLYIANGGVKRFVQLDS